MTAATSTCAMVAVAVVVPGCPEGGAAVVVAAGLDDLKIADMMLPKILIVVLLFVSCLWASGL
jgi:hypothetical protein